MRTSQHHRGVYYCLGHRDSICQLFLAAAVSLLDPAAITFFQNAMSATTTTSILVASAVLCCVGLRCSAFTTTKVVVSAIRSSSTLSRRYAATRDFLHESEYPGDDFTHILGFSDCDHEPSKLQQIASNTLKDVKRNKIPVDTVSIVACGQHKCFKSHPSSASASNLTT